MEAELGAPLATLFAEFDREPCAAASLSQVHRARLRDGRRVAPQSAIRRRLPVTAAFAAGAGLATLARKRRRT